MPILTLLSDFGNRGPYVAQMKGTILGICPNCQMVDVTHEVERHDVLTGAFLLEVSVSHFPEGTVHLAVVDPGVGSERLPVVLACRRAYLVGPDNGLLVRAARKLGLSSAYRIQNLGSGYAFGSPTFQGRDVFAVAAAKLAAGLRAHQLGPKVRGLVELKIRAATLRKRRLKCCALHVDKFGNIVTNAENEYLGRLRARHGRAVVVLSKGGRFPGQVVSAYYEAGRGDLVVLRGSQGYVEVALREQDASSLLGIRPRDELEIVLR